MNNIKFCPHCMEKNHYSRSVCLACGSLLEAKNAPELISVNSILVGRYVIGKALVQNNIHVEYIAYDLMLNMPVVIREYYPRDICSRDHYGIVFPINGKGNRFLKGRNKFSEQERSLGRMDGRCCAINMLDCFERNGTVYSVREKINGLELGDYIRQRGLMEPELAFSLFCPVVDFFASIEAIGLRAKSIDLIVLDSSGIKITGVDVSDYADINESATQRNERYISNLCSLIYYACTGEKAIEGRATNKSSGTLRISQQKCLFRLIESGAKGCDNIEMLGKKLFNSEKRLPVKGVLTAVSSLTVLVAASLAVFLISDKVNLSSNIAEKSREDKEYVEAAELMSEAEQQRRSVWLEKGRKLYNEDGDLYQEWTKEYDEAGRLIYSKVQGLDGANEENEYKYDKFGSLTYYRSYGTAAKNDEWRCTVLYDTEAAFVYSYVLEMNGSQRGYAEIVYGPDGDYCQRTEYRNKSKLVERRETLVSSGGMAESELIYDDNDSLVSRRETVYDGQGRAKCIYMFDGADRLLWQENFEYFTETCSGLRTEYIGSGTVSYNIELEMEKADVLRYTPDHW